MMLRQMLYVRGNLREKNDLERVARGVVGEFLVGNASGSFLTFGGVCKSSLLSLRWQEITKVDVGQNAKRRSMTDENERE